MLLQLVLLCFFLSWCVTVWMHTLFVFLPPVILRCKYFHVIYPIHIITILAYSKNVCLARHYFSYSKNSQFCLNATFSTTSWPLIPKRDIQHNRFTFFQFAVQNMHLIQFTLETIFNLPEISIDLKFFIFATKLLTKTKTLLIQSQLHIQQNRFTSSFPFEIQSIYI